MANRICPTARTKIGLLLLGGLLLFSPTVSLEVAYGSESGFILGLLIDGAKDPAPLDPDETMTGSHRYRDAITRDPMSATAHYNLARSLSALRLNYLSEEAIAEYREAIRLAPEWALPHYDLGVALREKGLRKEAIQEFQQALTGKASANSVFIMAHTHNNLGHLFFQPGTDDQALLHFQEALRLDPNGRTVINIKNDITMVLRSQEQEQEQEQERQRREEARRQRLAAEAIARQAQEEQAARVAAERRQHLQEFLNKHHATDLSDWLKSTAFHNNPFAYQGQHVFLSGGYHKHIGKNQAIVAIAPSRDPADYIVQWDTPRNLAEEAANGKPFVRCIVKVLGTAQIRQGLIEREIPHVKEIECLKPSE